MLAGLAFGTTITSVLRVKLTGCATTPFAYNWAGIVVFAEANTSAGAPSVICAASVFDPPKEYFGPGSIAGNTFVSDDAAYTVMPVTLAPAGVELAPAPTTAA